MKTAVLASLTGCVIFIGWSVVHASPIFQQAEPGVPAAIITFTAEAGETPITVESVEAGEATATLSWYVANLSHGQRLALHALMVNEWVSLLDEGTGDQPGEVLASDGARSVIVRHPLNFGPPTYRLSIVDEDGGILDRRIVTLPYDDEAMQATPMIEGFSTPVQSISSDRLAAREARLNVSWEVADRVPGSNLIFEQIQPDGSVVQVELPRPNLWIPSVGNGMVAPVPPLSASAVTLRLRVVDVMSNEVYDEAQLEVSVGAETTQRTNSAAQQCTMSPLEVPYAAQGVEGSRGCDVYIDPSRNLEVRITSFQADSGSVRPGGSVTLQWEVEGAELALIEVYDTYRLEQTRSSAAAPPIDSLYEGAPAGRRTITMPETLTGGARIVLWAANRASGTPVTMYQRLAFAIIDLPRAAQDRSTPPPPVNMQVTFQPFEGGYMLWLSNSGEIWALAKSGRVYRYLESSYATLPDNPIQEEPPPERIKPVSGFGKVWGNIQEVRDALGWALGPEQGYTTTLETVTEESGAWEMIVTFPDGQRARLQADGTWRFVEG